MSLGHLGPAAVQHPQLMDSISSRRRLLTRHGCCLTLEQLCFACKIHNLTVTHLTPVLSQRRIGFAQVVPRDLGCHMVWHVHADVVGQELNPANNHDNCSDHPLPAPGPFL